MSLGQIELSLSVKREIASSCICLCWHLRPVYLLSHASEKKVLDRFFLLNRTLLVQFGCSNQIDLLSRVIIVRSCVNSLASLRLKVS